MRARFFPLLLMAAAWPLAQVLYPGCATIADGTTRPIWVNSTPDGAQVFVNGKRMGTAPLSVVVSRWGWHRVRIEMPGFQPCEFPLVKKYNGTANGNLLLGGVPIVVDALTGAIFTFDVPPGTRENYSRDQVKLYEPAGLVGSLGLTISVTLKPMAGGRQIARMEKR